MSATRAARDRTQVRGQDLPRLRRHPGQGPQGRGRRRRVVRRAAGRRDGRRGRVGLRQVHPRPPDPGPAHARLRRHRRRRPAHRRHGPQGAGAPDPAGVPGSFLVAQSADPRARYRGNAAAGAGHLLPRRDRQARRRDADPRRPARRDGHAPAGRTVRRPAPERSPSPARSCCARASSCATSRPRRSTSRCRRRS